MNYLLGHSSYAGKIVWLGFTQNVEEADPKEILGGLFVLL